jgi:hypothetical protein
MPPPLLSAPTQRMSAQTDGQKSRRASLSQWYVERLPRNEKRLTTRQRPAGDAQREYQEAWGSDDDEEAAEASDSDDDSDGDNTVI